MFPRPPRLEQHELSLTESDNVDNVPELQQPFYSIATEDQDDKDDPFQLMPPQLSVPLETGEQTGISKEIGRRALDGHLLGKVFRGSLSTARVSDRFDDLNALDLNDTSQLSFDKSVLRTVPDVNEEDRRNLGEESNIELIFT